MIKHILAILALTLGTASMTHANETLRVGYNNWVGFIAFELAQANGAFEEAGLNVVGTSFDAPGDGLIPLLSGSLDIHLTTVDAVLLRADKMPGKLKIIDLVDTSDGADAVVVSSKIKTIADLKGKKVGVTLNECGHVLLIKALESGGLTEKDVTLVNMAPDAAGAALKAGQIDAAVTWEPWISQVIGSGGKVIYSTHDTPNLILDCIATSDTAIRKKMAAIKTFLKVVGKSSQYVIDHPAEAARLTAKSYDMPASEIEAMLKEVKIYNTAEAKAAMQKEAAQTADELATFFKNKGSTDTKVDIKPVFDTTLLP